MLDPVQLLENLTPAERLVAAHLCQGMSNKEIAAALGKSPATVKQQVRSILRRAGVPSRMRFLASLCESHMADFLKSAPPGPVLA